MGLTFLGFGGHEVIFNQYRRIRRILGEYYVARKVHLEVNQFIKQNSVYKNGAEALGGWEEAIKRYQSHLDTFLENIHSVRDASNPKMLFDMRKQAEKVLEEVEFEIPTIFEYHQIIQDSQRRINLQINNRFINRTYYAFSKLNSQYEDQLERSKDLSEFFTESVSERVTWFQPWYDLLDYIKDTQDSQQLYVDNIGKFLGIGETQAEDILQKLLVEYPQLGEYHEFEQIFVKSDNIENEIDSLITYFNSFK